MIFASMSLKKPSHLMPFGYLTVIISFVTDRVFFGTSFDTMSICGMILTSAGLLMKLFMADDEPSESHIEKVKDENGTIVE